MTTLPDDPYIGHQFGDYVIEKLLGKGGMARVYRAIDPNLNRTAAIKVIEPAVTSNPEYTRRFNLALSPAVETVVLRALAKDPSARYESGVVLFDALRQAVKLSTGG